MKISAQSEDKKLTLQLEGEEVNQLSAKAIELLMKVLLAEVLLQQELHHCGFVDGLKKAQERVTNGQATWINDLVIEKQTNHEQKQIIHNHTLTLK